MIPYKYEDTIKNYLPDFLVITDSCTIIVEVKPKRLVNDPQNLAKRIAGKKYAIKNGFKYIILTEKELLTKKSKSGGFNILDYIV